MTVNNKPILKWAGGKTQLLTDLIPKVPQHINRYIEPFVGGGALFFALSPDNAIISDSNPELIITYKQIAENVDDVIKILLQYENTEECFYQVRNQNWKQLQMPEIAARFIFLNRTCFNGLFRVNKEGNFNVPFGRYKNPRICDEQGLYIAADILKKATIVCGDYRDVLTKYAEKGDFVFLDPPYVPVSDYADFKRYTKEQFSEQNHIQLAEEVERLRRIGCYVILTNSNNKFTQELYKKYPIDVVKTKRNISSNGNSRKGEDIIVTAFPNDNNDRNSLPGQILKYPPTRFVGSKSKLLSNIWEATLPFNYDNVLDLFSGSGIVSYMFKANGKQVFSNDYMAMSAIFTKAMIENSNTILPLSKAQELLKDTDTDEFVQQTFQGIYFSDEENQLIDILRTNIAKLNDPYEHAIALTALIRSCIKKRPRGLFTYTGYRYDDGRKDLLKSLKDHFLDAVQAVNDAVFDNQKENKSFWQDSLTLQITSPDLVYIDPPYYSSFSDNEYVRRYHFVEGIARDWKGVEIQHETKTKKFKSYPTPFSKKDTTVDAFRTIFRKYADSILVVSYSSNSLPTKDEMIQLLGQVKSKVRVIPIDYTYSFGNQRSAKSHRNRVQEYLFIGY